MAKHTAPAKLAIHRDVQLVLDVSITELDSLWGGSLGMPLRDYLMQEDMSTVGSAIP